MLLVSGVCAHCKIESMHLVPVWVSTHHTHTQNMANEYIRVFWLRFGIDDDDDVLEKRFDSINCDFILVCFVRYYDEYKRMYISIVHSMGMFREWKQPNA